jgi:hypothetical protein
MRICGELRERMQELSMASWPDHLPSGNAKTILAASGAWERALRLFALKVASQWQTAFSHFRIDSL